MQRKDLMTGPSHHLTFPLIYSCVSPLRGSEVGEVSDVPENCWIMACTRFLFWIWGCKNKQCLLSFCKAFLSPNGACSSFQFLKQHSVTSIQCCLSFCLFKCRDFFQILRFLGWDIRLWVVQKKFLVFLQFCFERRCFTVGNCFPFVSLFFLYQKAAM